MARKVNLNLADEAELAALPGIGARLAARIVGYRSSVGHFRTFDELGAVPGVSERMLEALRTRAGVEGDAAEGEPAALPPSTLRVVLSNAASLPYTGHRLAVEFTRREWATGADGQLVALWIPAALGQPLPAEGEATLELPNREDLSGDVRVSVQSPDGRRLHTTSLPSAKLPEVLRLAVEPAQFSPTTPNEAPGFGKPTRLKGRVIDEAGRQQVAHRQVVVWGAERD